MTHSVRALAFHHEGGYEAQRQLALAFAGEGGRIATVEDIVHARLMSGVHDNPWTHTIITSSRVYYGRSKSGIPLLVFAHGNGPEVPMSQEAFEQLIAGVHGDVAIVDMNAYRSTALRTEKKAGNRYTYEEACRDEIARAFFGRQADEFFAHHQQQTELWLDGSEDPHETGVLVINRIYNIYDSYGRSCPAHGAYSFPLTISSAGYGMHEGKRVKGITEFDASTNSGIDDLIFTPYYVVGVRGSEPLTGFERDFRSLVPEVKRQWPCFVQPIAEVPNDSFVGIKPDGSRERPYYLLSKWGWVPQCTGRIQEDGTHSTVPELRIKKLERVAGPEVVFPDRTGIRTGYPYPGMWEAVLKALPQGANAVSFGGSCHSGGKVTLTPDYWRIEVDEEPFHILMKCGEDFFTQYHDTRRPTGQPHRRVEKVTELAGKKGWRIPDDVQRLMGHEDQWSVYSYLMAQAPQDANAMWVENQSVGYQEAVGKNVRHVTVHYLQVELGDVAFRPFTEIRADFDWQIARRAEAGLLQAA